MIEIIPNIDSGKITNLNFTNEEMKFDIEVKVFTVVNPNIENNVGTILEKYRLLENNTEEYFATNKQTIEKFIEKKVEGFDNFIPDCVVAFLPQDKNRKKLLELVKAKATNGLNIKKIDISKNFTKIDSSKSIKKDTLTEKDFILELNNKTFFKNLLIIDDVIDEGKTVEIFLNKMIEKNFINSLTTIKMICLYNRPKSKKTINPLDILRRLK